MNADEQEGMHMPDNPSLPFFAYGIFRPGQLAFLQVKEQTDRTEHDTVEGWSL